MSDYIDRLKSIPKNRVIVFDTETTGTNPYKDEILSLSIVDGNGSVLFDSLIKPQERQRWPNATKINGIKPSDVKDKPTIVDFSDEICRIMDSALLVVGYNVGFDLDFLRTAIPGVRITETFDVMKEFAPINGEWNERFQDYKWVKLAECAKHYGYGKFDAHSALADTRATLFCFYALLDDREYVDSRNVLEHFEAEREKQKLEEDRNLAAKREKKAKQAKLAGKILVALAILCCLLAFLFLAIGETIFFVVFVLIAAFSFFSARKSSGQ